MNASAKALQILQKFNVLSLNGVDIPQRERVLPPNAIRRQASPNESSSLVRQYRPWYHYHLYCSHDRLWQQHCGHCARVISEKERAARAQSAVAWLESLTDTK